MMMAGLSGNWLNAVTMFERIAVRQHPVDDRQIVLEIAERLLGIRNGCDNVDDPVQLPSKRPR